MIAFGKTDRGITRSSNQDNFAFGFFEDKAVWAIVCDGMGGAVGGDIASRYAVDTIKSILLEQYDSNADDNGINELFNTAASAANMAIFSKANEDPELAGMGTTLVLAIVKNGIAYIAHAGDSRAYLIDSTAIQVTKDHSVVQELVDRGRLTPEEAMIHPHRNVITRALGVCHEILIDYKTHKLSDSTKVLLCTDGLTNCVDDTRLAELANMIDPENLPDAYISEANSNGGYDNITAVIICE